MTVPTKVTRYVEIMETGFYRPLSRLELSHIKKIIQRQLDHN